MSLLSVNYGSIVHVQTVWDSADTGASDDVPVRRPCVRAPLSASMCADHARRQKKTLRVPTCLSRLLRCSNGRVAAAAQRCWESPRRARACDPLQLRVYLPSVMGPRGGTYAVPIVGALSLCVSEQESVRPGVFRIQMTCVAVRLCRLSSRWCQPAKTRSLP